MKQKFLNFAKTVFLLLFITLGFISCEKCFDDSTDKSGIKNKQNKNSSEKFTVKIKKSFCAYIIIEIVDSKFNSYGMNWVDPEGNAYQNVFSVNNFCEFGKNQLKENQLFDCQIVQNSEPNNCFSCEGFLYTPPLKHNIKVVK